MIKKIRIDNIPPYTGGEQLIEPKHINFLFGLNGAGKTTISRYLRRNTLSDYQNCNIEWKGQPLKIVVYNKDFVDENFRESSIPGIFTLGEENIEIKQRISELNEQIKKHSDRIDELEIEVKGTDDRSGLQEKLDFLESTYTDKFWSVKQQFDTEESPLKSALGGVGGVLNRKDKFKETLLKHQAKNDVNLEEKAELECLCTQLFGDKAEQVATISIPSFARLLRLEQNDVLQKVIVGKEDVDIAGLIKKLGNDTWFRQGIPFLKNSDGLCPFCQKPLSEEFSDKVAEYFDESYIRAVTTINDLADDYSREADDVLSKIKNLLDSRSDFLKTDELLLEYQCLSSLIDKNKRNLSEKKNAPNVVVQLETLSEIATMIDRILSEANAAIQKHNSRIEHIKEERHKLTRQVWRYISELLSGDIQTYMEKKEALNVAINNAISEITFLKRENELLETERRSLEQKLTSVVPTANGINTLLQNYGFTGFSLKVDEAENNYQFVRANGVPAYESLSEGERNFVTFLYFMYSLKGNTDDSGHDDDKVVVVDDPVSSLDSDVLFLVSSLLRDLFKDIYDADGSIKQLFILSHNIYFFKEVSYKQGLTNKKTSYWMIVKRHNESRILGYDINPVTSTYEMLWAEVKNATFNPTDYNALTLANTMRRIIEHYFNLLGGMDLSKFHLRFPDGDRQVFKSLISWANAGSHSAFDDYSATPNLYDAERYLVVFKELFKETGHIAHYNMMMKNTTEDIENGQA